MNTKTKSAALQSLSVANIYHSSFKQLLSSYLVQSSCQERKWAVEESSLLANVFPELISIAPCVVAAIFFQLEHVVVSVAW